MVLSEDATRHLNGVHTSTDHVGAGCHGSIVQNDGMTSVRVADVD
jgi:hypothetical protein